MGQFTNSNDYLAGRKPVPTSESAHQAVTVRFPLVMAVGDVNTSDIGAVGILPARHIPVGCRIDGSDMDTGAAALIFKVGVGNRNLVNAAGVASADLKNTLISTIAADGGGAWGDSGAAVNTAFDRDLNRTLNNMNAVTAVDYDRVIIVEVQAGATTPAAGTLGLTLQYIPA